MQIKTSIHAGTNNDIKSVIITINPDGTSETEILFADGSSGTLLG